MSLALEKMVREYNGRNAEINQFLAIITNSDIILELPDGIDDRKSLSWSAESAKKMEIQCESIGLNFLTFKEFYSSVRCSLSGLEQFKSLLPAKYTISEEIWQKFVDCYSKISVRRDALLAVKMHDVMSGIKSPQMLNALYDAAHKIYKSLPVDSIALFIGNTPQLVRFALEKMSVPKKFESVSLSISGHPGDEALYGTRFIESILTKHGMENYDKYIGQLLDVRDIIANHKHLYFIDVIQVAAGIKYIIDSLPRVANDGVVLNPSNMHIVALNPIRGWGSKCMVQKCDMQSVNELELAIALDRADGDTRIMPATPACRFSDDEFMDSLVEKSKYPFENLTPFMRGITRDIAEHYHVWEEARSEVMGVVPVFEDAA